MVASKATGAAVGGSDPGRGPDAGKARAGSKAKPASRCSLTLRIGETAYNVRPVATVETVEVKAFHLTREGSPPYRVSQTDRGFRCSCPDAQYRHGDPDDAGCKHVRAMRAVGLVG